MFFRLSHRRHPNKEVALNCMHCYGDAMMVTCINACHPLRLKPYSYVQNIKHIVYFSICNIFVSEILCCVCHICIWILNNSNWLLGHLNGSVNCDVTGPLWCHQKAVSCLGWDKSISDTQCLSCTPRCMRQDDLMTVLSPQWDFLYWQDDIFILNQGPVMQKGLPCHVHSILVWKKQIKMHDFHVTVISMTSQKNTELVPGVWLNSLKIDNLFWHQLF